MNYNKPPLSFSDQIARLQDRGLIINDVNDAEHYLRNISFYRLRAYTYPFQDNTDPNHPFNTPDLTFNDIIDLYNFDRKLRLLVYDAIEKIEVALRTQIIYHWSMNHGGHWYTNPKLYRSQHAFDNQMIAIKDELKRSTETFIDHYYTTYTSPDDPPAWMSLEVISIGRLSQLFQSLSKGPEKNAITKYFGLNKVDLMENWMHAIANIRNICAHHGRLWNRRLTTHIDLPTHPRYDFVIKKFEYQGIYPYKLYPSLCAMVYLMNIINPQSTFRERLVALVRSCPWRHASEMGFPVDWDDDPFWIKIESDDE